MTELGRDGWSGVFLGVSHGSNPRNNPSRPPQSTLLHCQAPTLLLNRWLACLTGSSILVLKLTFCPDPFPRNLPNGLISRFLSCTCT